MTQETKKQPEHSLRFRDLPTAKVSIWKNVSKDGKTYYNFVLEYSYKDQKGNWQSEKISLLPDEVVKASRLLAAAYTDFQTLPQFKREPQQESAQQEQAA